MGTPFSRHRPLDRYELAVVNATRKRDREQRKIPPEELSRRREEIITRSASALQKDADTRAEVHSRIYARRKGEERESPSSELAVAALHQVIAAFEDEETDVRKAASGESGNQRDMAQWTHLLQALEMGTLSEEPIEELKESRTLVEQAYSGALWDVEHLTLRWKKKKAEKLLSNLTIIRDALDQMSQLSDD